MCPTDSEQGSFDGTRPCKNRKDDLDERGCHIRETGGVGLALGKAGHRDPSAWNAPIHGPMALKHPGWHPSPVSLLVNKTGYKLVFCFGG